MTRLQTVAFEFIVADEALRKALLRAERAESIVKSQRRLMSARQPRRIEVINGAGFREIHSLPIEGVNA